MELYLGRHQGILGADFCLVPSPLELRSIHERLGVTFVYVTHDQEEAMVVSDRIVLMNDGHVVQIGSPTQVYNNPQSEFASRFIGGANLLDGQIGAITEDHVEVEVDGLVLFAPVRPSLSPGQKSIVSIRPERVTIFATQEDIPEAWKNVFPGTVESTIFFGPIARYHIRLSNGQLLLVERATTDGVLSCHPGDQLFVGWETTSNVVLVA